MTSWLNDTGAAILRFFDAYSLRAPLLPAVLGAAPALAAMLLLISWKSFELSNIVAVLGALALIYALSDWARKAGKDIEPRLYKEMGGKPTVTMLFRSDDGIDPVSKDRYRSFLAARVKQPAPTATDETQNPAAASAFYELAGTWLRENTRDTKKFPILFNELTTYGFRRNLLGLKWPALALNVAVVLICTGLLWYRWPFDASDSMTSRIIVVLIVAGAHALNFLLVVTNDSVKVAARTYARQLIISCETAEAFPWDEAPRYLIRDRDAIYGAVVTRRLRAMGIRDKPISAGSPWQNCFAERLIGTIRRECVDHLVVFGEAHLRRVLVEFAVTSASIRSRVSILSSASSTKATLMSASSWMPSAWSLMSGCVRTAPLSFR